MTSSTTIRKFEGSLALTTHVPWATLCLPVLLPMTALIAILSSPPSCWSWGTSPKGSRRLSRNVPSVTRWTKRGATRWAPTCGVCLGGRQDRRLASPIHRPTSIKVGITLCSSSCRTPWLQQAWEKWSIDWQVDLQTAVHACEQLTDQDATTGK